VNQADPPSPQSSPHSSLFRIGKDSPGHWVVQDQQGCAASFRRSAEALKFAMFENGNRPQAVIMVPGVFELDMIGTPQTVQHAASNTQMPVRRSA
jgi:hypothetical protein